MARKVTSDRDDAPVITKAQFSKMRPMNDVDPGMVEAIKGARGRPRVPHPKAVISVRLSFSAKKAWEKLPTAKRSKLVRAMERGALKEAALKD
jgi:uncharacterized protein (DUF4415 family)